jgi:alpha-D-xyloside xylohydrolase
MKFNNGFWLSKEGCQQFYLTQAYSVKTGRDSVSVFAPCNYVQGKGDTMNHPAITLELSSPLPDIIRVHMFHHKGGVKRNPGFEINTSPVELKIKQDDKKVSLTSGGLTASIDKGNWSLDFSSAGKKLTSSGFRHAAYILDDKKNPYFREQLDLDVDECVYGLGERFTHFVKNGQVVDIYNADGGTCSEQAYKSVPFYVTNKGYGVFVNHPEEVSFEVASEVVSRVQFSVSGEEIDYFVINGPSIKDVLCNYTALTGRPSLPPTWSFGLWLTTSFTTSYDEKTITNFVDGMAQRDIPLSVFHFDCFWMKEFHLIDLAWDERTFPDPDGMIKRLKSRGLKISCWMNPYISQESSLFEEGMKKDYFIKRTDGDIWQWDMWEPGMAIVDFTNPEACKWFSGKIKVLLDMGVNCFKTDFGERIPDEDVVYYDGSNPKKMHNYYTYLYNKTVFNAIRDFGEGRAIVFARSATVGSQQFPVHWGGDSTASYASMAETMRGGLSLGMAGFGFWSHDIGGFEGTATPDLYKRWVAFGLLSSHSRLHGSSSYRVPWLFDEESNDVVRFFAKLKCSLMPYLFKCAVQATRSGVPVMRAMVMEFQNDPAVTYLERQYMLGDSLLVAPVLCETGDVCYYLPRGRWVNFLTGEVAEGGEWRSEKHGYLSLPLFVRPNSIVAVGGENGRPDYDYAQEVTLFTSHLEQGAKASTAIYNENGVEELTVSVERKGSIITLTTSGAGKPWTARLAGVAHAFSAQDAAIRENGDGLVIIPDHFTGTVKVVLD